MTSLCKKTIAYVIAFTCIIIAAIFLLGTEDSLLVFKWWGFTFFMGIGVLPLSLKLLLPLSDRGYFASKILSIALCGLITWVICCIGAPFRAVTCIIVCLLVYLLCWGCFLISKNGILRKTEDVSDFSLDLDLIIKEELLFLALFVMWQYLIGFRPAAYGTEKLMDYGIMASMMRSDTLPAQDMWYSGETINYYYGGQYYVVFMTKLFFLKLENSYNLFRAFLPAAVFVMGFSIVHTMLLKSFSEKKRRAKGLAYAGGVLAGMALTLAGNGHYIVFAHLIPALQEMLGVEVSTYWFSDSTRYIGYVPETQDKTIHEYPSYSFLLGDLHAHVINLMFVLLFISILLSWYLRSEKKISTTDVALCKGIRGWIKEIIQPEIIALSVLVGIFQWTNFWDFAIYFAAAGLVILAINIKKHYLAPKTFVLVTALQALLALVISSLVVLPFTLDFDSMFSGIALAQNHSRLYQLIILWGIPVVTVLGYALFVRRRAVKELFFIIMSALAILLVILPEIIYVRDIYEQGYARANTMFKFTYQAFVIFALMMSYAIIKLLVARKRKRPRAFGAVMLLLLVWTIGYFPTAVNLWLGDVTDTSAYQGSDATAYLETDFSEDAEAIRWLMENVDGTAVILEANGESYTSYNVVSAVTGLSTVAGWYTHEWLWRNDLEALNQRIEDILTIYTSSDIDEVEELIEKYDIDYIFVGTNEYEKYGTIMLENFEELGTLVYEGEEQENYPGTRIYAF